MQRSKRLLAAVAFGLSCAAFAAPARADYAQGLLDYEEGKYAVALQEFRSLARTGHAGSELMLGVMHFNGLGVARNEVIAAIYFRQAAEQGEPGAQLAFGSLHIRGIGVFQDLVEARTWLRICSQSSQPELMNQANALIQLTANLMTPEEIIRADRRAERWRPVRPGLVRAPR